MHREGEEKKGEEYIGLAQFDIGEAGTGEGRETECA
jgi:hypothetical protein